MKKNLLLVILLFVHFFATSQTTLVSYGSTWKYLDNGSNQGTAWIQSSFNDAAWATGAAPLGYGNANVITAVSFGSNANKKYLTTYFRLKVTISDASAFGTYTLNVKRDDGAVIYINGVERYRTNMPTGSINANTKAAADATDNGNTAQTATLPAGSLVTGTNVIAVEVHQRATNSDDLFFDLQLVGNAAPPPCDAPSGLASSGITETTAAVSWAPVTGGSTYSVDYKPASLSSWTNAATAVSATSITLTGLTAGTVYDWRVRTNCSQSASSYSAAQFTTVSAPVQGPNVITYGSIWKYLDNGTNQGTAWRASSFNDGTWASGPGQLGYGDGDEATVVGYGPNASAKFITTYFRKSITLTNPSAYSSYTCNVKRDDGIAIYINGTEVYRNNLAAGAGYTTLASLADDDGAIAQTFTLNPSAFVSGTNVIAVEIHQNAASSTDISFDLELTGNSGSVTTLTRGPYLQMGGETAITFRWRTGTATDSRVQIGSVLGSYPMEVNDPTVTTEHTVAVTGLNADTKYFYTVGSSTQVLQSGSDNFFTTLPPAGTSRKLRIAAFGDCGRNDNSFQTQTLTQYRNFLSSNGIDAADAWLLLGDNAYNSGTDSEYSSGFFGAYGSSILKNHKVYPSPGNHDYANTTARQTDHNVPYYSIFSMPTNGELGGVASGTKAYYSYDIGDAHFLSLDSYGFEAGSTRLYDTLGPQVTWIKNDLAATNKKWVIAYWHHPPYTKGSHNSDTETELINMRENFIRILERNGVDLILCGHSHDYERSYLLKGYYKASAGSPNVSEIDFNAALHTASQSSGKYDNSTNSCPYTYAYGKFNHGTVYVVAGSAGADGSVQAGYPHNALNFSQDDGGMFYFEIEGNRLDAKFIRRDGVIADRFTIMHDVNKNNNQNVTLGMPVDLSASWPGNYSWNTGETTKTITVTPPAGTTVYIVNDNTATACVSDTFTITASDGARLLTRLNAQVIKDQVELRWNGSDKDNYFTLERSADGRNFETIAKINAQGRSNNSDYAFTDHQPISGSSIYRLTVTDNTNHLFRYNAKAVYYIKGKSFSANSFDTEKGLLKLSISAVKADKLQLGIYNMDGKLVKNLSLNVNEGVNINTIQLTNGVYVWKLYNQAGEVVSQTSLVR